MQGTAQRFALVVCGRDEIHSEDEKKLEARKLSKNAAESHKSTARIVGQFLTLETLMFFFERLLLSYFLFSQSQR